MRVRYWIKDFPQSMSVYAKDGALLYFHTPASAQGFIEGKLLPYIQETKGRAVSYDIATEPIVYKDARYILHPSDFTSDYVFEILDDIGESQYSKSGVWEHEKEEQE